MVFIDKYWSNLLEKMVYILLIGEIGNWGFLFLEKEQR